MIPKALLWLFVLNLGVVFGAGIYEARISVARWIGPSTTIPLTLLTLAKLWAASQSSGPIRMWWLTAALAALADRIFTFTYFIPRMVGLLRAADSPEARAKMMQWANLNYLRLLLVLVAWLAALQTFALLYARSGQEHAL